MLSAGVRNHLPAILLLSTLFPITSGCVPTEPDDTGGPLTGEVDAAPPVGADGGTGATCDPPATTLPNGNHNAGMACLGCHTGAGAPRWNVAGTLYSSAQGGTPVAGATITIVDADNVTTRLVTASNGNFYTGAVVAFPIRVVASKCPDSRTMGALAPGGNCNSCHQVGSAGRIHLP